MKAKLLLFSVLFFVWISTSQAIIFDRRPVKPLELSFFTFPIVGNIPGVQSFYGLGVTLGGIAKTDMAMNGFLLRGEANENFDKHGDGKDFGVNIFVATDIPVSRLFFPNSLEFKDLITFSLYAGDINNFAVAQRERGIDSQLDDFNYILLNKSNFRGGELSLYFFEKQLEIYYNITTGEADPLGFVDTNGKFTRADAAKVASRGDGGRWGVYLDDTDSRRDPRIGYRLQYERYNLPSSQGEAPAFYQNDYNLTGFIPLTKNKKGVLVLNQFYSEAVVTQEGTVNPDNYDCAKINENIAEPLNCSDAGVTDILEKRLSTATEEARLGNATALGGSLRLRGYPQGRFFDSYANFQGVEFRYYLLETEKAFDWVVEKGVYTSMQLAAFYEQGTVAPRIGELWKNIKNSYGFGIRAVLSSFIFRLDVGFSEEGSETTVFFGYPF